MPQGMGGDASALSSFGGISPLFGWLHPSGGWIWVGMRSPQTPSLGGEREKAENL